MAIGKIPVAEDATPVFIAGAPRSGTTLLTAVMNSHPQVMITNELRPFMLLNDLRRRTAAPSELSPDHPLRDAFRHWLLDHAAKYVLNFYRYRVSKDELGCPSEAGGSVERVIKAFGDKNPGYADPHSPDCLEFIKKRVPQAKFIHIHRDPRACVASYLAVPVYSNDLDRCINVWTRHTKNMIEFREKYGTNVVMNIRYEDFVTKQGEEIFQALERHIGVDAAREPLEFLRRERSQPIPYRSPTTQFDKLGKGDWGSRLDNVSQSRILKAAEDLRGLLLEDMGA